MGGEGCWLSPKGMASGGWGGAPDCQDGLGARTLDDTSATGGHLVAPLLVCNPSPGGEAVGGASKL